MSKKEFDVQDLNTHDPNQMYKWGKERNERPFIIRSFLHFLGFIAMGVGLITILIFLL
jgi:hypothetical protein|tara:strand:+ start:807 stop:980 length:174 start_codon:yes stop_codon:yes gene_type:complete